MKKIEVASGNKHYVSENDVLYNINKTLLVQYPAGKEDKKFAFSLLKHGFVHCIGTDAHNMDNRAPDLLQAKETVEKAVVSAAETEGLTSRDALEIKKKLSLEGDAYVDFVCYSSDSVMDVREYMLIKPADGYEKEAFDAIGRVISDKLMLFKDYAPEEGALLSDRVLVSEKGFIFLAVGKDAPLLLDIFRRNL